MADDIAESDLTTTINAVESRTRGLESGANGFSRAMTQAFSRAVVEGRRLDDVLKALTLRLSDLSLRLAMRPLERGLAGAIDGLFANLIGGGKGGPIQGDAMIGALRDVNAFADGGVIARPSYFPMGRGAVGLAGEAGPEAVLPLARGGDGRLGVVATAGGSRAVSVTVNIASPDVESFRRSEAYMAGLIARAVARGQRGM